MAKGNDTIEDQVDEVEETEETESKALRPKDLAEELEIDPKALRGFLRRTFPRDASAKNTSWALTEEMAAKARAHFSQDEEDDSQDEDGEDEA